MDASLDFIKRKRIKRHINRLGRRALGVYLTALNELIILQIQHDIDEMPRLRIVKSGLTKRSRHDKLV